MPVVDNEHRLEFLRALGLSEPLISQSTGNSAHDLLNFRCMGPPWFSYHGAACPGTLLLAPLWDCGDVVTGVWQSDRGLEFLKFSIEAPADHAVVARSEQGLWASVLSEIYEDSEDTHAEDLVALAAIVRFRFVYQLIERYGSNGTTTQQVRLREVIEKIDAESSR